MSQLNNNQLQNENLNFLTIAQISLSNDQNIETTFSPVDPQYEELFHCDWATDEEEPFVETSFSSCKRRRYNRVESLHEADDFRSYQNEAAFALPSGATYDISLEQLFHCDWATYEEEPFVETSFSSSKRRRCDTLQKEESFNKAEDFRSYQNQAGFALPSGTAYDMSSDERGSPIETIFSNKRKRNNIKEQSSKDGSFYAQRRACRLHQAVSWDERFQELCTYRRRTGHCVVPYTYKENIPLTRWVQRQRYQYKLMKEGKLSAMTTERVNALEGIGFVWDFQGATWLERFGELQAFYAIYSHCNVPTKYNAHPRLAKWVKNQRHQYKLYKMGKPCNMTPERICKLKSLNFE